MQWVLGRSCQFFSDSELFRIHIMDFLRKKKKVYQIHGNLQNPMAALQILFFNDFLTIGKCWIIKFSSEGTFKNELPKKEFGGQPHVFAETLEFHISFWLIQIQENQWHEMGGLVVCNDQIVSLKMQPLPLGLEKIFIFPTDICKRRPSVKVSSHFESCLLLLGVRRLHSKTIRLKTLTSSILITC